MTTVFEEFDTRMAEAIGRSYGDTVRWRPMLPKSGGSYTARPSGGFPDRARPVRTLTGIMTWAPVGLPIEGSAGGGMVANARLLIDFEAALFGGSWRRYGTPLAGDWVELPDEPPGETLYEILRLGDDGSARIWCWCVLVSA